MLAIAASGDSTRRLRALNVPTLVLHGAEDPLVAVSGGKATAAAIRGAELVIFRGMGHDLPSALHAEIATRIAALIERVEARLPNLRWRRRAGKPGTAPAQTQGMRAGAVRRPAGFPSSFAGARPLP